MSEEKKVGNKISETKFSVEAILEDRKYKKRIDLFRALLDPKKQYSLSEVDELFDNFNKGEK